MICLTIVGLLATKIASNMHASTADVRSVVDGSLKKLGVCETHRDILQWAIHFDCHLQRILTFISYTIRVRGKRSALMRTKPFSMRKQRGRFEVSAYRTSTLLNTPPVAFVHGFKNNLVSPQLSTSSRRDQRGRV